MLHTKAPKLVMIARTVICLAFASALVALPGCKGCRNNDSPDNGRTSKLPDRCFTRAPSLAKQQEIAKLLQERRETSPMQRTAGSVTIQVYFHVLTDDANKEGVVAPAVLMKQIDVLNAAFAGTQEKDRKSVV